MLVNGSVHVVTFACDFIEDAESRLEGVKEEAEENNEEEVKEEMATLKPDVTLDTKSSTDYSHSLSEGSNIHKPSILFPSPTFVNPGVYFH